MSETALLDEDPLLLTADVARKLGVKEATIKMRLYNSRKKVARGEALAPNDIPIPDDAHRCKLTLAQGGSTLAPRWRQSVIDPWIAALRADRRRSGSKRRTG